MILKQYGVSNSITNHLKQPNDINYLGRVVLVSKNSYKVITNMGVVNASLKTNNLYYKQQGSIAYIGDFVVLQTANQALQQNGTYLIDYIIKPYSSLTRKIAGKRLTLQTIANNIDYAFITVALDDQFNLKKANRMLTSCIDGNVKPVVVLSKADMGENLQKINQATEYFALSNTSVIVSGLHNNAYTKLLDLIQNNKTAVFIGSSGSGKSTLVNLMLNSNVQKTASVSQTKHQGTHTTTNRQMFLIPSGGIIIDTPGMREFAVAINNQESLEEAFADVTTIALQCKFTNCTHTTEPNCNIQTSLQNGSLSLQRYQEYSKLHQQLASYKNKNMVNKVKNNKQYIKKVNKQYKNNKDITE